MNDLLIKLEQHAGHTQVVRLYGTAKVLREARQKLVEQEAKNTALRWQLEEAQRKALEERAEICRQLEQARTNVLREIAECIAAGKSHAELAGYVNTALCNNVIPEGFDEAQAIAKRLHAKEVKP